jgi:hypothetical protein
MESKLTPDFLKNRKKTDLGGAYGYNLRNFSNIYSRKERSGDTGAIGATD